MAMSTLSRREEEAHQSPTALAAEETADATSWPQVRGFHPSSPVGSTYRRELLTAYTYRSRLCARARWPRMRSWDSNRPISGS